MSRGEARSEVTRGAPEGLIRSAIVGGSSYRTKQACLGYFVETESKFSRDVRIGRDELCREKEGLIARTASPRSASCATLTPTLLKNYSTFCL